MTALEALNIIKNNKGDAFCEAYKELLDTIEATLKRYELIFTEFDIYPKLANTENKLKALEIINIKDIDVWLLKHSDYENYCRIRKLCLENTGNADVCVDTGEEIISLPTEEEFNELKGVLL